MSDLRERVEVLRREADGPGRSAARAVRQAAARGRDIGAVVDDLFDIGIECDDITLLAPITEALVYQALRRGPLAALRPLLRRKHFRPFVVDALRDMAQRGDDVTSALDVLIDEDVEVLSVVEACAPRHPALPAAVAERLAAARDRTGPAAGPAPLDWAALHALQEASRAGLDLTSSIPVLSAAVDDPRFAYRMDALVLLGSIPAWRAHVDIVLPVLGRALADDRTLYVALPMIERVVREGGDISSIRGDLETQMEEGDAYIREQGAKLVALWLAGQNRWSEVLPLFAHRRYGPRAGAAIAVGERVDEAARHPAIVRALEENLAHPSLGVRLIVRSALREMGRAVPEDAASSSPSVAGNRFDLEAPASPPSDPSGTGVPLDPDSPRLVRGDEVVVLYAPFDPDRARSLPEIYRELGTRGLRPVRHCTADRLLASDPDLDAFSPFITCGIIAYEAPGRALGQAVVFAVDGAPTVRFRTGRYAGQQDLALYVEVSEDDFEERDGVVHIHVDDARLVPLYRFPDSIGWYLPETATGIPCGFSDLAAPDARKLIRLVGGSYVGPVARGTRFDGRPEDDRRTVLAGTFAIIDRFAVLAEPIAAK
jgi:hypothetical protein